MKIVLSIFILGYKVKIITFAKIGPYHRITIEYEKIKLFIQHSLIRKQQFESIHTPQPVFIYIKKYSIFCTYSNWLSYINLKSFIITASSMNNPEPPILYLWNHKLAENLFYYCCTKYINNFVIHLSLLYNLFNFFL